MIAAISLMRRRDDVTLLAFRRHWLDVHGPLVCRFPALRHYMQDHVVASPASNAAARDMRIDGFPVLWFDDDADRLRAHESAAMAACNVDSRLFIGAVSRVICEPATVVPMAPEACPIRLIALLPGDAAEDAALDRYVAAVRGMLGLCGLLAYRVLQQGPAPHSTIPHLPVSVVGIVELAFGSIVELEEAVATMDDAAARFVVEQHRLV